MSLRQQAEADIGAILEDGTTGFGWPITITDPAGLSKPLTGFANDIAQLIDPETGQAVSGRLPSIAIRIQTLIDEGFTTLPRNIADASAKPWVVVFDDINGHPYTFKVTQGDPDRAAGVIVCMLEVYSGP